MREDDLDDVLSNIEPEDTKRRESFKEDLFSDPELNKEIEIDLESEAEGEEIKAGEDTEAKSGKNIESETGTASIKDKTENDEATAQQGENIEETPASERLPLSVKFTVRGNRTWNTREPYIIKIDNHKLKQNYDELNSTIYFVESPESETSVQGKIKLSLLKNITGERGEIISRYQEFVYKALFLLVREFGESFNLNGDKLSLFIYHTGVYTVYRMLLNNFQSFKIGFCYQRSAEKKVTRNFPAEFIKVAVLNWFEDNINIYDLPFDGIHEYNEIKRLVTARYYSELEKYNKKLDELILENKLNHDKKFSREEFFRSKWDEWFGVNNIILYNRFIERTIFKISERHTQK